MARAALLALALAHRAGAFSALSFAEPNCTGAAGPLLRGSFGACVATGVLALEVAACSAAAAATRVLLHAASAGTVAPASCRAAADAAVAVGANGTCVAVAGVPGLSSLLVTSTSCAIAPTPWLAAVNVDASGTVPFLPVAPSGAGSGPGPCAQINASFAISFNWPTSAGLVSVFPACGGAIYGAATSVVMSAGTPMGTMWGGKMLGHPLTVRSTAGAPALTLSLFEAESVDTSASGVPWTFNLSSWKDPACTQPLTSSSNVGSAVLGFTAHCVRGSSTTSFRSVALGGGQVVIAEFASSDTACARWPGTSTTVYQIPLNGACTQLGTAAAPTFRSAINVTLAPTPSASPTASATATPSQSPTTPDSPTPSATASFSPPSGASPSETPSPSPSPPATPPPTASPSPTPPPPAASASAGAPTGSRTGTGTRTGTRSPTATLSVGASPSITPTQTVTPNFVALSAVVTTGALPNGAAAGVGVGIVLLVACGVAAATCRRTVENVCSSKAPPPRRGVVMTMTAHPVFVPAAQPMAMAHPAYAPAPAPQAPLPGSLSGGAIVYTTTTTTQYSAGVVMANPLASHPPPHVPAVVLPPGWTLHSDETDVWYTDAEGGSHWVLPSSSTPPMGTVV